MRTQTLRTQLVGLLRREYPLGEAGSLAVVDVQTLTLKTVESTATNGTQHPKSGATYLRPYDCD